MILSVAPVPFAGSMPFIMMMVLGLGGMCAALSIVAARMKKGCLMAGVSLLHKAGLKDW